MSIAVQTAVGEIGSKATTEVTLPFEAMVNVGGFQYGLNSAGVHRLNAGNTFNLETYTKSFTLCTSDYGHREPRRFSYIYANIEVFEDSDVIVSVRENKGTWVPTTVSIVGSGVKTIRWKIPMGVTPGALQTIKFSSTKQFRIFDIRGLLVVKR